MTELQDMSAAEITKGIKRRDFSAREALDAQYARIAEVNPVINAVVTQDPEAAYAAAAAADALTASGADTGILHGLPMTHKDTHNTRGMLSTQGSPILKGFIPAEDDLVVARLRTAGVVASGKSNVPEFGAGSHTFNEVFGTTLNPYDTTRSAGGSSGGLGAALAARIQPLGEGSDMGGSLRIPASFCNVAGLRPSYGVIPMPSPANAWTWLGRTGPMAREISDIALFMSAVAGPSDLVATASPLRGSDFAGELVGDLRGVRIGWSEDFGIGMPVEPEVLEVLRRQLRVFEEAGAIIEQAAPDFSEADLVFERARATDFAAGLGPLVRKHRELVKPEVIWNVELGWSLSAEQLIEATAARTRLEASVRGFFSRYDVFLSPAAQVLPFDATLRYPAAVDGTASTTYLDWMRSACVLSATSLPVLAVPAGFTASGLPVGFQLAVNHYRDADLLRYGKAFEDRTRVAEVLPGLLARDAASR
ncbi:amidase [Paeniglutamicibacter cryotolerans]|uniref:Amidase n=1 Tax=Paeniglutamicibacter cryotolerans TaxID=670079 RepID=A0A839QLW1_9MICC|nr:amidase family protein [Paeniglutamicibacter cryotolerans]MBB2995595.1 amidase [Paeniglutamicibacter cryotolerans]